MAETTHPEREKSSTVPSATRTQKANSRSLSGDSTDRTKSGESGAELLSANREEAVNVPCADKA